MRALELLAVALAIALLVNAACLGAIRDAENFGPGPSAACSQLSDHCGHVYACTADDPMSVSGHIETCIPDDEPVWDAEELYGTCVPTPRHSGECVWGCKDDPWEHKCNSYSGCFGCKRIER